MPLALRPDTLSSGVSPTGEGEKDTLLLRPGQKSADQPAFGLVLIYSVNGYNKKVAKL